MGTLPEIGKGVRTVEALVRPPHGNCVALSERNILPSSIRGRGQTNSKCAWDDDLGAGGGGAAIVRYRYRVVVNDDLISCFCMSVYT